MFNLQTKLIIFGLLLAVLGGGGFYMYHLHHTIDNLKQEKIELSTQLDGANNQIKEDKRRDNIVNQVDSHFEIKRNENEKVYEKKVKKIDEDIREGKDRPVGPLLNEFFNDGLHND